MEMEEINYLYLYKIDGADERDGEKRKMDKMREMGQLRDRTRKGQGRSKGSADEQREKSLIYILFLY
jgi:hypothetical protein